MALTPSEKKKLLRLEKSIAAAQKEKEAIIDNSSKELAQMGLKFGLWQLDKHILEEEFLLVAQKHALHEL